MFTSDVFYELDNTSDEMFGIIFPEAVGYV